MSEIRMQHKSEVIHSMDGLLMPCPICGSPFELIHEWYINRDGHEVNYYYWMQKTDVECLLDEIICQPFTIGAGDCDVKHKKVGEYGERWNKARMRKL